MCCPAHLCSVHGPGLFVTCACNGSGSAHCVFLFCRTLISRVCAFIGRPRRDERGGSFAHSLQIRVAIGQKAQTPPTLARPVIAVICGWLKRFPRVRAHHLRTVAYRSRSAESTLGSPVEKKMRRAPGSYDMVRSMSELAAGLHSAIKEFELSRVSSPFVCRGSLRNVHSCRPPNGCRSRTPLGGNIQPITIPVSLNPRASRLGGHHLINSKPPSGACQLSHIADSHSNSVWLS